MKSVSASQSEKKRRQKRRAVAALLDSFTPTDAHEVLRALIESDKTIASKAAEIAKANLEAVDREELAGDVQAALESIDIEEVWDRSGPKRHGYVDPAEAACEVLAEELEPYAADLKRFMKLGMRKPAMHQCMGILKGIYLFDQESETEYKSGAGDAPSDHFHSILDEWSKGQRKTAWRTMFDFIKEECNEMYSPRMEKRLKEN